MREQAIRRRGPGSPASEGGLIDLRRIANQIRRYWWLLAAIVAISALLTNWAYESAPRVYSATAQVALERRQDELVQVGRDTPALTTDSSSVDTEVEVLQSPALNARVVDRLRLYDVPEFGGVRDGALRTSQATARERAINALRNRLEIRRNGTSYAIGVTIESASPQVAAQVVNMVVDEYVGGQVTSESSDRQRQTRQLGERLGQLRSDVISAEAAVARYRAANNLFDIDAEGNFSAQEMAAINTELAQARAAEAAAQARVNALRGQVARPRGGEAQAQALDSSVVNALRAQQGRISADRAALSERYGPRHPDIARIDEQLTDTQARIRAEIDRIASGLRTDALVTVSTADTEAQAARGRTTSLQNSLSRAQGGLQSENNASVRLNELERQAQSARGLYQAFNDRYRGIVAEQGTERSNAQVIARARIPQTPISPNPLVYLILGALAALGGSAAALILLRLLENGLQSTDEAERKLGLPVVGSVPDIASIPGSGILKRNRVAPAEYLVANPGSVFAESFRSIRAALQLAGSGGEPVKVVAITSALPGEGKTTTAICLARAAAMAGQRVVLVDCDLRQRATSRNLATTIDVGLVEVLQGSTPLESALVHDSASGAFLLPQTLADGHQYDLMGSPEMAQLVARLKSEFDLVVLDSAPVIPVAEARLVAAMADGVLFVTRWRKTPVRAAERALDHLERAGADVAGVVLALVNLREQARSGSGDDNAYYKSFAKYYA